MILKDQTTSSTSDSTKTKSALLDKYKDDHQKEVDGYERLKSKETNKLPNPTGWRMLVLPFKLPEKTKGGLFLGQDTLERQQVGSTCGLVLAMGPHCYDKDKFPEGPWCKKGDWIIFARYAGSRIQIDGGEVRLLNDDEVLATIRHTSSILKHRRSKLCKSNQKQLISIHQVLVRILNCPKKRTKKLLNRKNLLNK
jgi:chaperonin GroES